MPLLEIKKYPHLALRKKSEEIKEINLGIKQLGSDMLQTMYENQGCGLAAPQVGIGKRMIVVDAGSGPIILVNPEIVAKSRETVVEEEGCLSLPGILVKVKRAREIEVKGIRLPEKKEVCLKVSGLLSVAFQHEIDHLDGILILDKAGPLKKWQLEKTLRRGSHKF